MTDLISKVRSQAGIIVDLLRLVRTLREEYAACAELLGIALESNRDMANELKAERDRRFSLLAQHRALISGRTNAEERQAIEEAA